MPKVLLRVENGNENTAPRLMIRLPARRRPSATGVPESESAAKDPPAPKKVWPPLNKKTTSLACEKATYRKLMPISRSRTGAWAAAPIFVQRSACIVVARYLASVFYQHIHDLPIDEITPWLLTFTDLHAFLEGSYRIPAEILQTPCPFSGCFHQLQPGTTPAQAQQHLSIKHAPSGTATLGATWRSNISRTEAQVRAVVANIAAWFDDEEIEEGRLSANARADHIAALVCKRCLLFAFAEEVIVRIDPETGKEERVEKFLFDDGKQYEEHAAECFGLDPDDEEQFRNDQDDSEDEPPSPKRRRLSEKNH
ncbi:hypothetical protein HMN09_01302300 [Mycena chlorophos]|uniref:Uncharacterized protein n=1 Tax=Mycena chlorophos TaxID=658473 RepID=A0A8H6S1S1_MYCCL|nr:hypothetical protein HMN09_01302300 [Mycena chlorophos]